jgi:uncharacterized protein YbaA (DUF1428 family)
LINLPKGSNAFYVLADKSVMNTEKQSEIGSQIRVDIYKIPKKNHDALVETENQFVETFRKQGCFYQSFQLSNNQKQEGFTSMSDTISANQDEEVWMDVEAYTDRTHMDNVISKVMGDERALSIMKRFLDLLSPGFSPIRAEFRRLAG